MFSPKTKFSPKTRFSPKLCFPQKMCFYQNNCFLKKKHIFTKKTWFYLKTCFQEKKVFLKKCFHKNTCFHQKKMRSKWFKNQQSKQKVAHGFDLWSCFFFSFSVSSFFLPFFPPFFIKLILQIFHQEFSTDSLGLVYVTPWTSWPLRGLGTARKALNCNRQCFNNLHGVRTLPFISWSLQASLLVVLTSPSRHFVKAIQSNLQCKKGRVQLSEMRSGVKMWTPPGFICHTNTEIIY